MKWLADENLRHAIIRGLLRRNPTLDIVRVQDIVDVSGTGDLSLLRFATNEQRILITQDVSTMIPAMQAQLRTASRCARIVFVPDSVPVATAIADLLLLDRYSTEEDWIAGVLYLPLR